MTEELAREEADNLLARRLFVIRVEFPDGHERMLQIDKPEGRFRTALQVAHALQMPFEAMRGEALDKILRDYDIKKAY